MNKLTDSGESAPVGIVRICNGVLDCEPFISQLELFRIFLSSHFCPSGSRSWLPSGVPAFFSFSSSFALSSSMFPSWAAAATLTGDEQFDGFMPLVTASKSGSDLTEAIGMIQVAGLWPDITEVDALRFMGCIVETADSGRAMEPAIWSALSMAGRCTVERMLPAARGGVGLWGPKAWWNIAGGNGEGK